MTGTARGPKALRFLFKEQNDPRSGFGSKNKRPGRPSCGPLFGPPLSLLPLVLPEVGPRAVGTRGAFCSFHYKARAGL